MGFQDSFNSQFERALDSKVNLQAKQGDAALIGAQADAVNAIKNSGTGTGSFGGVAVGKKGINKVPGKGDGTKDTVPAVLAPGEAVLNKKAAENMGRGMIAKANKKGAQQMGMI